MSNLKLSQLVKTYGKTEVLHSIDLDIQDGEFVVLVGPSGCGKSTTLRLIAGLEEVSGGIIEIGDQVVNNLEPKERNIAMVFQNYAIYPHMTVRKNIGFGLRSSKMARSDKTKRIDEIAEILGMTDLLSRKPSQLSGGQRQRVAIGRAMVRDPAVFLFDEPLSNLDAQLRTQMRLEIKKLHQRVGATIVFVTHDQVEAMTMADRIVVLKDGVVQQVGTPMELYEAPQSLFVAGFIGSPKMNLLTGAHAAKFDCTTVGIRSEHLDIVETGGDWEGEVVHTEILGSDTYIYLNIGDEELFVVRQEGNAPIKVHTKIAIKAKEGRLHRFNADGAPI